MRRPLWFCRAAAVERAPRGLLKPWLVLSRARLHFARVPLLNVPAQRRAAAIRLQLMQLSPWANTGFAFRFTRDTACVWYWDEEALATDLIGVGARSDSAIAVPECEMRALDPEDGILLIRCLDGVEGQVWHNGELHASMWWPQTPDAAAWNAFVLDAGIEPATNPPPLRAVQWRPRPSEGLSFQRGSAATATDGRSIALRLAAALLGAYAIWLAIAQARIELALRAAAQSRSEIEARLGPVIDLRRQADRDTSAAARLLALRAPVTQAELLLALSEVAGAGKPLTVREWEFRDDRLRIVLSGEGERYDRAAALSALARVPWLRDISLAREDTPGSLAVLAQIAAPGTAAPATGRP